MKDLFIYLVHGGVVDIFIAQYISRKQLASCCVTLAALALANTVSLYSIPNQRGSRIKCFGHVILAKLSQRECYKGEQAAIGLVTVEAMKYNNENEKIWRG
jgi:hypothetical protein